MFAAIMSRDKQYFVYIATNARNGTLYIGITNNIYGRIHEHRTGFRKSFTSRYGIYQLVYYEAFEGPYEAICREKQLKVKLRSKKIALIESENPKWENLAVNWYRDLTG